MALNLQDKKAIIAKFIEVTRSAHSAVIADSRGITVDKITKLRKEGRGCGVYMHVVRNTLMRRVVKDTPFQCLQNDFLGPTLIAFSMEHPGAAARLFKDFAKLNKKFKIKSAAFQSKFIPASQIDFLATMPTYEEAIASFMSVLKDACAGKLVRTLTALCEKIKDD
ncbi:50S ribosomal protein L10 [Candidatus Profftia sp. (ex Adelges kitamiensis)]|uniref:50S ribosomal protein L10 n=1 Tax=Candidatus Profftia sp. (ex Adelges kitamiensis) TaxID=2864218 RepID=UPI001CE2763D|nr:50S ribosomal protein L10 [Candidatus Profftia sp. (ex Adelges kitamiensis)]